MLSTLDNSFAKKRFRPPRERERERAKKKTKKKTNNKECAFARRHRSLRVGALES